jgi:hypothetical protein
VKSGQGGGRRRPHVTARRERATLRAGSLEERVDILASYAEGAPDAYRRQHAGVDPVADRLRGDLELLGDLVNGEELSLPGGQGLSAILLCR